MGPSTVFVRFSYGFRRFSYGFRSYWCMSRFSTVFVRLSMVCDWHPYPLLVFEGLRLTPVPLLICLPQRKQILGPVHKDKSGVPPGTKKKSLAWFFTIRYRFPLLSNPHFFLPLLPLIFQCWCNVVNQVLTNCMRVVCLNSSSTRANIVIGGRGVGILGNACSHDWCDFFFVLGWGYGCQSQTLENK